MLAHEGWVAVGGAGSQHAHGGQLIVTASAIDVFVELDRLTQVYAHFAKLQPLPPECHRAVISILGGQATDYVDAVVAACAPRTP
eukprot:2757740-Prymnesium_polylepis.1